MIKPNILQNPLVYIISAERLHKTTLNFGQNALHFICISFDIRYQTVRILAHGDQKCCHIVERGH